MQSKIIKQIKNIVKTTTLPKNAVGREITTKAPIVSQETTVGQINKSLFEIARGADSINCVYVVNDQNKLVGAVSIKEIVRHLPETIVKDIMVKTLVVSHPRVDRKRVVYLAIKHNLKAVPIVDEDNRLLGLLSSDKILTILYKEHKKEAYRHAGIVSLPDNFDTILDQGIWRAFITRIPWIVIGLIGGIFAAQVVGVFEMTLSENIVLAAFIPLVVYVSDAVGTQTQTIFVRDIAFNPKLAIVPYTLKQLATTTFIGVVCGCLVLLLVSIIWDSAYLGGVIGLATFMAISSSAIIAIFIPFILGKLKQDPAIGSGPFATILQDILSIYVYFLIASALL